jgi:alanyl-tRNA synthetase
METDPVNTNQIRELFLSYYEARGHSRVASSSLLPGNDPTLLFTNAGMNQFKDRFLHPAASDMKRAVSSQKCLRISGKHNDLEEVGHSARHNTFFEMLGNFSFGDYFKKDAILFAWDLITNHIQFEQERLWVTIFETDDEAFDLWTTVAGVSASRIIRLGEKENFWSMGDTGPCGPCSEIHYYTGEDLSVQSAEDFLLEDGRYIEFYNLVFMQFDRSADGTLTPLSAPSIDTGMGLERVAHLKMGAKSNFDSQGLRDIIAFCERKTGFSYEGQVFARQNYSQDTQYQHDVSMRVIADHTRAVTLLIAEGVQPGSEGRSYVLRRLIRRAIRHGKSLGLDKPFLHEAALVMQQVYADVFPELKEQSDLIQRVLLAEEEKFRETLESGLKLLEQEKQKLQKGENLSGRAAFLLHDTYGFPLDLTQDALRSEGIAVDEAGFHQAMQEQKQRSQADRKGKKLQFVAKKYDCQPSEFIGYRELECESSLLYTAATDEGNFFIAAQTPFYAESGGQVGDTGYCEVSGARIDVLDTQKTPEGHFLHFVAPKDMTMLRTRPKEKVRLFVDKVRRSRIAANHSATHLLHTALRETFGPHVRQAGSRVDEHTLRFDYSHFESPQINDLETIEQRVLQQIMGNYQVNVSETSLEEAKALGAMALFGEKYGERVRMVQIGPDSTELCGGTHVQRSGDIGGFVVVSEASISSGVRRIECKHGTAVLGEIQRLRNLEKMLAETLGSGTNDVADRVHTLIERSRLLEKQIESLNDRLLGLEMGDLLSSKATTGKGVNYLCSRVQAQDMNELRASVDSLRSKIESGVVILVATSSDAAMVAGGVAGGIPIHVGKLLGAALTSVGGKGGGRDTFAQGGGIPLERVDEFLNLVRSEIQRQY